MAVAIKEHSPEEIRVKIHNLTNRYKKEKKIIGPSGGSPSEWNLYSKIHSILGGLPIHNTSNLVEESVAEPHCSQSLEEAADSDETEDVEEILLSVLEDPGPSSSSSMPRPVTKKRKMSETKKECNKLDAIVSENLKNIQKTDEQILEEQRKSNAILERIATACEVVQREIVSRMQSN
ncbi:uncharacterized protein LOC129906238 [Episyrphus balteatus]|uniref:uncharacterized protein LOC129906238 n=1 Tax=Episyrphus balteatus TaxID=286459 RepID=UPI002485D5B3|nr:uncharacterized protein LOC129906238 [Episyrphus balteatus]